MYDEAYIQSHDIDWFCVLNGIPIHVASNGGVLPDLINNWEQLRRIQHEVSRMENICSLNELIYNEDFLRQFDGNNLARRNYVSSFQQMSLKGFWSFDRTSLESIDDNRCHLVCKPVKEYSLPTQVLNILPRFESSSINFKHSTIKLNNLNFVELINNI